MSTFLVAIFIADKIRCPSEFVYALLFGGKKSD